MLLQCRPASPARRILGRIVPLHPLLRAGLHVLLDTFVPEGRLTRSAVQQALTGARQEQPASQRACLAQLAPIRLVTQEAAHAPKVHFGHLMLHHALPARFPLACSAPRGQPVPISKE